MLSFSPQSSCTGRLSPAGFLHPLVSVYQAAAAGRSAKNPTSDSCPTPRESSLLSHHTHTHTHVDDTRHVLQVSHGARNR